MIVLDYQDRRPIYEQVTDKFQILILNGVLPPGSQMPSVRQLATELSVNPNTLQRAYMELENLGLIYPVKGRGNFVADSSQVQKINRESYRKEFTALIQKGRNTGFNREELEKMLAQATQMFVENANVEVPVGANSKNAMVPLATVNTRNILFICGGAFPGLEDIIKERLNKQASIGFRADLKDKYDNDPDILEKVTLEDIRNFGMIS